MPTIKISTATSPIDVAVVNSPFAACPAKHQWLDENTLHAWEAVDT